MTLIALLAAALTVAAWLARKRALLAAQWEQAELYGLGVVACAVCTLCAGVLALIF